LIHAERQGGLPGGRIQAVIADREGAYALERAKTAGIPVYTLGQQDLSDRILYHARQEGADLIILGGLLSILGGDLIREYQGRMINLHPSLLPKFGGPGMYGERVHRAVLASGETESGCTVHLVDAGIDTGPILLQRRVPVLPGDTPVGLAARVHQAEHRAIVDAAALLVSRIREVPAGSSVFFP
jgi:phosphoribosylglycinamide formyltransferase-1